VLLPSVGNALTDHSGVARPGGGHQIFAVSTRFAYALVLTVSVAGLHLLMYFSGFETDKLATGHHFYWLIQVFLAVVLWRGIKALREQSATHAMTYARGVGHGMLISLYGGLMCGVYVYFHFKYINPHFADYQLACLRPEWSAAGMTAAQMTEAEKMTRMLVTPLAQAVMTPVIMVCFGLIFSLLIAAFLKRNVGPLTSPPFRRT
jgi:hypothetical protein